MPNVISNLSPALVQTFATIFVGYMSARLKLIPIEGIKSMGSFITIFALPALLLRNMATLDLGNIEWNFFLAVLFGKALLFVVIVVLCLLRNGCTRGGLSDAGMFSIFSTQSNDFAMGLPILTALFAEAHPSYPGLLYVVSPISLVILNPIGMFLMECGREDNIVAESEDSVKNDTLQSTSAPLPNATAVIAPADGVVVAVSSGVMLGFGPGGVSASGSQKISIPAPIISSLPPPSSFMKMGDSHLDYDTASDSTGSSEDDSSSDEEIQEECPHKRAAAREQRAAANQGTFSAVNDNGIPDSETGEPEAYRGVPTQSQSYNPSRGFLSQTSGDANGRFPLSQSFRGDGSHNRGSLSQSLRNDRAQPHRRRGHLQGDGRSSAAYSRRNSQGGVNIVTHISADGMSTARQVPVPLRIAHGPDAAPVSFCRTAAIIFYRVGTTPIVLSSVAGILLNFALGGHIPDIADSFLAALGETFSAVALFVLGANMVGKLALFQDRRKLFLPLLLVGAKSLVLPIIIRLFIAALGVDGLSDLTLCAFLVGTFPAAPSVHFFGVQFGARSVEIIAPSMVLSTFVAAPIMFVSAQMITVTTTALSAATIVSDSSRIAAGFGFLGSAYCGILFIHNRRWRTVRERLLLQLLFCQAVYCISLQFCVLRNVTGIGEWLRFAAVTGSLCGTYFSTVSLAVNEIVRRYKGPTAEKRLHRWYVMTTCILTFLTIGSLTLFASRSSDSTDDSPSHENTDPDVAFDRCWMVYGRAQWIVQFITVLICFFFVTCGALWVKTSGPSSSDNAETTKGEGNSNLDNSFEPNHIPMNTSDGSQDNDDILERSNSSRRPMTIGPRPHRYAASSENSFVDRQSDLSESLLESHENSYNPTATPLNSGDGYAVPNRTSSPASSQQVPQKSACPHAVQQAGNCPYADTDVGGRSGRRRVVRMTLCEVESFWLFAMKIQLFLYASSLFLDGALLVWSNDTNGIRIEMMLLASVLFASMGLYTCGLFGLSKNIISPLRPVYKWLRRCLKDEGKDSLTREQKNARKAAAAAAAAEEERQRGLENSDPQIYSAPDIAYAGINGSNHHTGGAPTA